MPSPNVALVGALQPTPDVDLTVLFARDDEESAREQAEALAPLFTDDFVCVFHGVSGDLRPGIDGLRSAWLDWLAPWQSYRAEIDELIEVGDRVLVLTRDYGRRPGDDHEVELFGSAVYTVRAGQIARAEYFTKRVDAFADVGLPERPANRARQHEPHPAR
jgi:ketosteroid isomerase-like protein